MACMRFGRRGPSWWFLRTTVSWSSRLLKLMKPNFPEHFLNSRHYPRQAFKWPQYGNQRMPTNGCKVLNFQRKAFLVDTIFSGGECNSISRQTTTRTCSTRHLDGRSVGAKIGRNQY